MNKIILLIRSLDIGGAEVQLVNLAIGLSQQNLDVLVVVFYSSGKLEDELKAQNVPIVCLQKQGRWDIIRFGYRFLQTIKQYKPTVIYSFLTGPNLCAILTKLVNSKVRLLWGVRASTEDRDLRTKDLFADIGFRIARYCSWIPQKIIVNSISGLHYHERIGFSKKNLVAIPNGIDVNQYHNDPVLGNSTRVSMGIRQNIFLVGNISRIDPIKALEIFLRAARKFLDKYDDVMFVIVGKGDESYTIKLKRLATDLELSRHLIWVPETRDLVGIYNALDINTLTSLSEGFPNVLCEAMACGTICAASDTGDCRQIIGDSGFLVNCGNIDGFVDAWEAVYLRRTMDYHKHLTQKATANIVNQYSLKTMIERTITQLVVTNK